MKYVIVTSMPDEALAARWDAFLTRAPFATHYVTPNYFTDPYVRGDRFAVLAVDKRDKIAAVLTGVRNDDRLVSGMFSRPQMVFANGVDKAKAVTALMSGLDELGADSALTEIYAWEPLDVDSYGMRVAESSADTSIVMLDLAKGCDALFAGFSQTRRNEIRKAETQNLVEIKEPETFIEIEALYRIHCDWNARKGNSTDTLEQMQTAIGQRENRRVFIAKVEGKTIAGSFYRSCAGGVVEYAANFSLPEYQRLRPNDLIGWHAIKWACENGFSRFSMGGAHLFLRRFGGEIVPTYRYRRDASRFRLHDLRDNAREFGIGAYQRLPENVRSGVRKILAR
jgi:hypothetical protein